MFKKNKKFRAFTLSEVMVVFSIIAVVATVTMKISQSRTGYATRYLYYAAFTNLEQIVGNVMADGYTVFGSANVIKGLPAVWNNPTANATNTVVGLCDRMMKFTNTLSFKQPGSSTSIPFDCSVTATEANFTAKNAKINFVTTNGMRYYNSGNVPTAVTPFEPYLIYIDINGAKGDGKVGEDVMPFTIGLDGIVRPEETLSPGKEGATDTRYLSASYRYWDTATSAYITAQRGIPYQQAVCESGTRQPTLNTKLYACGSFVQKTAICPVANNTCEVILNIPGL